MDRAVGLVDSLALPRPDREQMLGLLTTINERGRQPLLREEAEIGPDAGGIAEVGLFPVSIDQPCIRPICLVIAIAVATVGDEEARGFSPSRETSMRRGDSPPRQTGVLATSLPSTFTMNSTLPRVPWVSLLLSTPTSAKSGKGSIQPERGMAVGMHAKSLAIAHRQG